MNTLKKVYLNGYLRGHLFTTKIIIIASSEGASFAAEAFVLTHICLLPPRVLMHEDLELQCKSFLHSDNFLDLLSTLCPSVIITNKFNANNNFKQENDIFI